VVVATLGSQTHGTWGLRRCPMVDAEFAIRHLGARPPDTRGLQQANGARVSASERASDRCERRTHRTRRGRARSRNTVGGRKGMVDRRAVARPSCSRREHRRHRRLSSGLGARVRPCRCRHWDTYARDDAATSCVRQQAGDCPRRATEGRGGQDRARRRRQPLATHLETARQCTHARHDGEPASSRATSRPS
jgi:hypothetical protein